jgi:putative ABC transport system substrate-binding protein
LSKAGPDDAVANTNRIPINILAVGARLPTTVHGSRDYVEAGGLMSLGANYPDQFRRSADYGDEILRGAKPADLPVQQSTKIELTINMRTAKSLGVTYPLNLLGRGDEVIE